MKTNNQRTKRNLSVYLKCTAVAWVLFAPPVPVMADSAAGESSSSAPPVVVQRVTPQAVKVDASSIRATPAQIRAPRTVPEGEPAATLPRPGVRSPIVDPVIQINGADLGEVGTPATGLIGAPILNFPAIDSGSNPPDTVMDVGPNHVVQMTNGTFYQIFNKQGADVGGGVLTFGSLWAGGDACNSNLGDPIVVYDHLADRWVLSQFARNAAKTRFWMCIAVSQTPSPLPGDGYYLYTIEVPVFPDYPKFGVWPDAYYMSSYEGSSLGVFAFERQRMLNGEAANVVKTTISSLSGSVRETRILPADLDGPPPAGGTPGLFFRSVDDLQDILDPTDRLEIFEFVVDWMSPGAATFGVVDTINGASSPALAPFNTMACDRTGVEASDPPVPVRDCIPQPDSDDTIDALSNRPMMQLKFRALAADDYRMVVLQTIDVSGSIPSSLGITPADEVAGIRWYELQKTGANWGIRQQGTYAPQPSSATAETDLLHRWMGSAAMDHLGNIAFGYSVVNDVNDTGGFASGGEVYPGIRYSGRSFDDPLGLMQQGEKVIFNGTRPQGNLDGTVIAQRWGDYSALSVDPVDDCTFWYTTHVSAAEAARTRIAAFRFNNCGTDLAITKTANPSPATSGGQLIYTVVVTNNGPLDATNVKVVDTLPAGVAYQTNTDSCSAAGQVLTCLLGTLASGGSRQFDISVLVNSNLTVPSGPTTITNTAVVSSDQADVDASNNQIALTTIVNESADLALTKLCKPDGPAATGSTATCTIFVDNLGSSDARNVVVTDTHLSNGSFTISSATFDPPAASACGITGGVVTCNLGTEPAGGRSTITVEFTSNDQVDVNDTATVQSDTPDPATGNNSATGRVSFTGSADLHLVKTAAPGPVVAGENLTYLLTVTNEGPSAAPNVVVKDVLPAEVSLVSAVPSQGACSGTTVPGDPLQPLTCNIGALASAGSATVTVVVKVNAAVPNGTNLVNNAAVASDYADPDNGDNNATAVAAVVTRADLAIVKTADKAVYKPSTLVTYTVRVANNGSSDARQVVVTDNLPNLKLAIYKSDTGGCVKNATTPTKLTCNLGYIPNGEFRTFQVYMLVRGSRGVVSNSVTVVSSDADPALADNTSTVAVTIGK